VSGDDKKKLRGTFTVRAVDNDNDDNDEEDDR
jgi:hypothetical protein